MAGNLPSQYVDAIIRHNEQMIEACDKGILSIHAVPYWRTYDNLVGQMAYWKHAKAAFKWSIKLAEQQRQR